MVDFIKLILSAEILESGRVIGIIMPFAFLLIFLEVINFENAYYQYNYTFARGGDYRRSYRQ